MSQITHYILLASPRTGSNLLNNLLNSHLNILAYGELFDRPLCCLAPGWPLSATKRLLISKLRDLFPFFFINQFILKPRGRLISCVGFKLFYSHVIANQKIIKRLLNSTEFKIIHLQRKNFFNSLVSYEVAKRTNIWVAKTRPALDNANKIFPITIDPISCRGFFEKKELDRSNALKFFKNMPLFDIYYEDLVKDQDQSIKKICCFLGVPLVPLKTETQKIIIRPNEDIVENYDELKNFFSGTKWSRFFNVAEDL